MMRFIMPVILIGISVAVFFVLTNPFYSSTDPLSPGISMLRDQVASYDKALDNSQELGKKRDELTKKKNSMDPDDLIKLQKLLPDNIDNIRLIIEIGEIAKPYGMTLKDVKYNATTDKNTTPSAAGAVQVGGTAQSASKDYGVWDLEFSTVGTYSNFLNFLRDLESNLRIVDISSIQFSSNPTTGGSNSTPNSSSIQSYRYGFKIKTYWLKD